MINMKVEPLGKKSEAILDVVKKFESPSTISMHLPLPCVWKEGEGCYVKDPDGNTYLDFSSGIAVLNLGHCHPNVVKAICDQSKKLIHATEFPHPKKAELLKKLSEITPLKRTVFSNCGTEAIETALKVCKYASKKHQFIAFQGAFHGRTHGSMALTSRNKYRIGFEPVMPGVHHVPYPYCYRCPFNEKYPDCSLKCVNFLEKSVIKNPQSGLSEISAVFVEPFLGEGGYVIPPDEFLPELRRICDENNIILVMDEIQTGFGRSGKMFAYEHYNVVPDILVVGKAMAGGFPMAAVMGKEEIMTSWGVGLHTSTFGGNPLGCAASIAIIDTLKNGVIKNAEIMGNYLIKRLNEIKNDFEIIGDVRGRGLFVGIELVSDKKKPATQETSKIIGACRKNGLILLPCGRYNNVIRLIPPLIIKKEEIDTALNILIKALAL